MRINSIQNQQQINKKQPQFTGFQSVLRFLDTNQAWGANAVDFGFMVLPRTWTDFGRGSDAGWETARRESMGTINDSSVGAYGMAAGLALATGVNNTYGLKNGLRAHSLFADSETIDMMGDVWHSKLKTNSAEPLKEFLKETLSNYEALSPTENGKWVKLDDNSIEKIAKILEEEIKNSARKISKEGKLNAKNLILSSLGAENNIRIRAKGSKQHTSRYTIDYIIENIHKLGQLFNKDNIKSEFKNAVSYADVKFVKMLKNMNLKRSLAGVGIATLVGVSTQPINMYLTKKKTGKDGFVGGGTKDNSTGFKFRKLLVALGFSAGVIATIGKPKDLIKHLQFKGFTPTINQLKFIYGATIVSRFLASRNDNELGEAARKDILGFTNWLILGNFVQKLVAQAMDKTLIKRDGNGFWNWIGKSSLKTRDEVLHAALGKDAFKEGKALTFKQMLKAISTNKAAKKQLMHLNFAQIMGYLYSGLVLGYGIPKLNIYITNRREAKKNKKLQDKQNSYTQKMLKPENQQFLERFTGKLDMKEFVQNNAA